MWKAGLDRATELQGAGRGVVLLTDVTDVERWLLAWPAHLSLPFWMEAWPRLALSKSGEFLLRFVLVERMLFCGEERTKLLQKACFTGRVTAPLSLHLPPGAGTGRQTAACFSSGG